MNENEKKRQSNREITEEKIGQCRIEPGHRANGVKKQRLYILQNE